MNKHDISRYATYQTHFDRNDKWHLARFEEEAPSVARQIVAGVLVLIALVGLAFFATVG